MVYKNFTYRIIFSIILLFVYILSLSNIKFLFTFGILIYLIIFLETIKYFRKYLYLIFVYLLISFICFYLYIFYFLDLYYFNLLILSVICFDSASYVTGNLIGKTYILKKISPKKTWEGFLGGLFFTNLFYFLYEYIFKSSYEISELILINLIILFSFLGDLIQSFFKRQNNLKNSSNFLPGHGGFFDRFDSFISSIFLLFFYSYLYL